MRSAVIKIVNSLPHAEEMHSRAHTALVETGIELHKHLPASRVRSLLQSLWQGIAENWGGHV